uniref:Uncharacterized protein n=1 Tax=Anguilla anguilla TaxID=7936 RepID=A0A0E9T1F3_ANGAN
MCTVGTEVSKFSHVFLFLFIMLLILIQMQCSIGTSETN